MQAFIAERAREAGPEELARAMQEGRERLLGLFSGFEAALGPEGLAVAHDPVVNLPLWELGHIGWFEEHWLARNPERGQGDKANAQAPRANPLRPQADRLYDSSRVAHLDRWRLELPTPAEVREDLSKIREHSLRLLREAGDSDEALYFFRLVLFHEDMHREAWHFIAQHLGLDLGAAMRSRSPHPVRAEGEWQVPAGPWRVGWKSPGFAFDNELDAHERALPSFRIDRAPVSWGRFLPFVDGDAYRDERHWSEAGRAWRRRLGREHPAHLRRGEGGWERQAFGRWSQVSLDEPAIHLSFHEAEAWCRWEGRRLPSEFEWEAAAVLSAETGEPFDWGEVWEWTASRFGPYEGFRPHPYRDYSQPWFDGRPVLRGGSFATEPRMKHPRYRNFFAAERTDLFSGFRSCASDGGRF